MAQADWRLYLGTILAAFAASAVLTPLVRWLALRFQVLDQPGALKTHKGDVPHLGGVAVFAAFAGVLLALRFFTQFPTGTLHSLRGILLGAGLIFGLGLVDDLRKPRGLGFKTKFLFQFAAALGLLYFDIRIQFLKPEHLAVALTVLWIVGITNAMNIIDIMDGLCAGQAAVAAGAFLLIALPSEDVYVNAAAAALAGASLGFLPFNLSHGRRIFLGDSGALFIGFVLAAVSLGTRYSDVNPLGVYAPLLILGVPLYDTLFVMLLRMQRGHSPFLGSKDHFALRLESLGLSRRQVVLLASLAALLLAGCAFLVTQVTLWWAGLIYLLVALQVVLISARLAKVKV